jgi:hypothetical protein
MHRAEFSLSLGALISPPQQTQTDLLKPILQHLHCNTIGSVLFIDMSQEHLPIAPPLASALQNVKLRSAPRSPHRDEHAGAATLTASAALAAALQTERGHNARLRAVDLESWYDSISDKTFKTIFLPLAPNEARCITQEYHRKIARAASAATQDISSYVPCTEDDTRLLQLQARISDALAALGGHGECQALRALGVVVILVLPFARFFYPPLPHQLFVHLLQLLSSSRVVAPKTRALVSSVL